MEREQFKSRLGFLLAAAGCSIGLGNFWRFPYITGVNGGSAFVLMYLACLILIGVPVVLIELAVGRSSRRSIAMAFDVLETKGTRWHWFKPFPILGNYLLMSFYVVITGWLLYYFCLFLTGSSTLTENPDSSVIFTSLLDSPHTMEISTVAVILTACFVCGLGVVKGVERITKPLMILLFFMLVGLAVYAMFLPGAGEGLSYYLSPDFGKLLGTDGGKGSFWSSLYDALGQAFFTLSIGIGSIGIFGSYIAKDRSLVNESLLITCLDTFVAFTAGLIIFPICFSYDVPAASGPNLIFVALTKIFTVMPAGEVVGTVFFLLMFLAALTTVIAVIENIIAMLQELLGLNRKKSAVINFFIIALLSLPVILGFNVWSFIQIGGNQILDILGFLVSNNILPIGALVYILFVISKSGMGWGRFSEEVNTGSGIRMPGWLRYYFTVVLPIIMLVILVMGYVQKFSS